MYKQSMSVLFVGESDIEGSGVFTKAHVRKGALVGTIKGPIRVVRERFSRELAAQSFDWIGVGRYSWIDTQDSIFKHINHSCEPNAAVRGRRTVYALRDITPGTEVTMDYSLTEADPDWVIPECHCRGRRCRKKIGPIFDLPKNVFERYRSIVTKNFARVYQVGRTRSI